MRIPRLIMAKLPVISLALSLVFAGGALRGEETYDLIFKTGTLAQLQAREGLAYSRVVSVRRDSEFAERNTGIVRLALEADDTARLTFHQGEKSRNLGAFPASVGNPIIMYFVETVLRDVAQEAGGSPFYIRNRIKESLLHKVPITDTSVVLDGRSVPAQRIVLRPFENDKNRDKMRGFGDLTLTFTMSEGAPGWYHSLVADVPAPGVDAAIYTNSLVLRGDGEDR